jgi:hypothetical protein
MMNGLEIAANQRLLDEVARLQAIVDRLRKRIEGCDRCRESVITAAKIAARVKP